MNQQRKLTLLAGVILVLMAACQQAETPPETREDIAAATTQAEVDVAIAKAEGEHEVEMQRCEALTGNERQSCKDQADVALDAARDAARGIGNPSSTQ